MFDQTKLATIIPEQESDAAFAIKHTTFTTLTTLHWQHTKKFIKPVAEDITSPIVNIINSSIDKEIFPDIGKWRASVLSLKSTI